MYQGVIQVCHMYHRVGGSRGYLLFVVFILNSQMLVYSSFVQFYVIHRICNILGGNKLPTTHYASWASRQIHVIYLRCHLSRIDMGFKIKIIAISLGARYGG